MRQGYIDSQGNKYILTGIKAQFPKWTYAQWQAEGEPEIPWIRTDAPSGYRKVSGDDVSYDNTQSVNEKIDKVSHHKVVWTGSVYNLNDEFTIADFNANKKYLFIFKGFSGSATMQFVVVPLSLMQFIIQGETTQYKRYRIAPKNQTMDGTFRIFDVYGSGDAGSALIQIEEI